jgi:hypothetical protein
LNPNRGRPSLISSKQQEEIKSIVLDANKIKKSLNTGELKNLLIDKVKESAMERGGNGLGTSSNISHVSMRKYQRQLGLTIEKGQRTTEARRIASMDIRNFISMAVMNHVCGEGLSWHSIFNMDATQFILSFTNQSKLIGVQKSKDPTTRTGEDNLNLMIKQYFLVSASGLVAPPLFIIGEKSLGDNEMILLKIRGLNFSYNGTSYGYIIFMPTRTSTKENKECYKEFNKFLFQHYVVEFIRDCRENSHDQQAYLVIDGEATQLEALDITQTEEILKENKIDIGKGPASCSGVCGNALDCGNLFKATKTSIRGKEGIGQGVSPDSEMEEKILNEINNNNILKNDKILSSGRKRKISSAIVYLFYKEMNVLTRDIIKGGFQKIGMTMENYQGIQYNINTRNSNNQFPKLNITLSCCPSHRDIEKNELDLIRDKFPTLIDYFEHRGEITEKEFDDLNIRKNIMDGEEELQEGKNEKEKNERVLHRQRAVLLTKDASVQRRLEYKKIKQEKENKKLNAPTQEEKKINAMARGIILGLIKNVVQQEKIKNKKRIREEKIQQREEGKKKLKIIKNNKNNHIPMSDISDDEDNIPLSKINEKKIIKSPLLY